MDSIKKSLNINGVTILKDEHLHDWYFDSDIEFDIPKKNKEPLLVNTINSWNVKIPWLMSYSTHISLTI